MFDRLKRSPLASSPRDVSFSRKSPEEVVSSGDPPIYSGWFFFQASQYFAALGFDEFHRGGDGFWAIL